MSLFPPDDWVTVGHSPLEAIAEMMCSRLEAEGIDAVLRGNKASGTAGVINELNITWNNPLGGVEVRVHESDAETARGILAQRDDEEETEERTEKRRVPPFTYLLQLYLIWPLAIIIFGGVATSTKSNVLGLLSASIVTVVLLLLARRSKK